MKVAMIGAGGWGTAMMISLAARHDDLFMYCRNPETAQEIQKSRENKNYLPGCRIPLHVKITSNLETAVKGAGCVILCTPSHAVEAMAESLVPWLEKDTVVVCASKGLADHAGHRLSEVITDKVKGITKKIVVLSGPNHAEEVGRGLPCATVAASEVPEAVQVVQDLFMSPVFRVYTSPDITGIELGGALKNVIALAAGTADGLGYGDNTKAALITRGIAEIARLGTAMGAHAETFYGLSGIGDLIVTCASVHSRNRKAGYLIGQGRTMQQAMDEVQMIVEGVYSAKAGLTLSKKFGIETPIIQAVNQVLFENKNPKQAVDELMQRMKKDELAPDLWER